MTTMTAAPEQGDSKGQYVQVSLNRALRLHSRLAEEIRMIESRIAIANTTPDEQDKDDVASMLESRLAMTQAIVELATTISVAYAANQGEGFRLVYSSQYARNDRDFFASLPTPVGTFTRSGTYAASLTRQQAGSKELASFAEEEAISDQLVEFEMRTNVQVDSRVLNGGWYAQAPAKGQ